MDDNVKKLDTAVRAMSVISHKTLLLISHASSLKLIALICLIYHMSNKEEILLTILLG